MDQIKCHKLEVNFLKQDPYLGSRETEIEHDLSLILNSRVGFPYMYFDIDLMCLLLPPTVEEVEGNLNSKHPRHAYGLTCN